MGTKSNTRRRSLGAQPSPERRSLNAVALGCALASVVALPGCVESDRNPAKNFEELDLGVCAPDQGPFTLDIDNPLSPFPVGRQLVLEGFEGSDRLRVEVTVLDETEDVAGVTTRVVEEKEFEDGELVEISRNFFVQAPDGTVCYYGEDVDDYDNGQIVGHEGEWRAGVGANVPGILMPGNPRPETKFYQEFAPGVAEDRSAILALGVAISVPAGDFTGAHVIDWDPLDGDNSGDADEKFYAEGIGIAVDEDVDLITFF